MHPVRAAEASGTETGLVWCRFHVARILFLCLFVLLRLGRSLLLCLGLGLLHCWLWLWLGLVRPGLGAGLRRVGGGGSGGALLVSLASLCFGFKASLLGLVVVLEGNL